MFVHALSGAASFAACLRLFRSYPLAVSPCYPGGWQRSIVLRHRAFEGSGFYILTQDPDEHFTLRPWHPADGECQEIRPGTPVPVISHRVITEGMPVPRDGALLGWVSGYQVQAVLAACGRLPEPWDDASAVPGVLVMPLVGSQPAEWPPLAVSPLDDGSLWTHVERRRLVDIGPLVTRQPGCVFLVPGGDGATGPRRAGARVVVTERLSTEEFWLPAGVYADHWTLREGMPVMTARQLLALPGVVDLAGGHGQVLLGV